ncbi:MAG: hypothetical protein M3384_12130 [Acidobacteriota bacterium]|nr:hypothetical protein [Acidobacteriota bacterium]
MLKKIGLKVLIAMMIVVTVGGDSLAQTRIRFARGRSAATMSGSIAPGGVREYVLNVGRGQTMTVQVTSGNNRLDLEITGRNGHIAWGDNGYAQVDIDRNGDHYIAIRNSGRRATRFNLTVTVR